MYNQDKKSILYILLFAYFFLTLSTTAAKQEHEIINMNEKAISRILRTDRLANLGNVWPVWKTQAMIWPSKDRIDANSVEFEQKTKVECIRWLKKLMKEEFLIKDLDKYLIAMDNWGLFREKSKQERFCDVFICRFTKGSYVVQILESPFNVVISVADETLADKAKEKIDHRDFILQISSSILHSSIVPDPLKDWFQFEPKLAPDGSSVTRVQWAPPSIVIKDKMGTRSIDTKSAAKIGTFHIEAETNGSFVRFDIIKSPEFGPRLTRNPYEQRFGTSN